MLRPTEFRSGDVLAGHGHENDKADIVLEGELDIELAGAASESVGPGTSVLMPALVLPDLADLGTVKAGTDGRCLALGREDVAHLRAHREGHGSPLAVWRGILLDDFPESIVIGAGR